MNKTDLAHLIKSEAYNSGFSYCGIARARRLDEHEPRLAEWLNEGYHGQMSYMENYFEKRLDPRLLVDGAKTVISVMTNYFPDNQFSSLISNDADNRVDDQKLKVSKYAWNVDYHFVIKKRLSKLVDTIKERFGEFNYRIFVDSAPILDRAWAVEAGIGWIGKNTMLISRKNGSYYFLAEIVTDLEPEYDKPFGGSYCGDCTRCIDACPTQAILPGKKIDSNKCISYLTIELKDELDNSNSQFNDWIFGCDICQDVCPWNKFSIPHQIEEFKPSGNWINWSAEEWKNLEKPLFNNIFKNSALKRAGFNKLKNTINFVTLSK